MLAKRFALPFALAVSVMGYAQEPPRHAPAPAPAPETPQFSRFSSSEGRFSIMFPGRPAIEHKNLHATKTGRLIHSHSFLVDLGPRAYMVMYSDYDNQTVLSVDDAIAGIVGSLKNPVVTGRRNATFFGHAGSVVDVNTEPNLHMRARVFAMGTRLYQIALIANRNEFDDAEPDFFLNSFYLRQ